MNEIKRVLIHIRPPLQAYTALGFLYGLVLTNVPFQPLTILALSSWMLLCAGITVFNSYYDKDTEPVAGLKNPPSVSISMLIGSLLMKLAGLLIALFINSAFLILYIFLAVVTMMYSHKDIRLKSNAYIALFVNFLAGFCTYLASASLSQFSITSIFNILGSICAGLFLVGIYLLMQVHQGKEDRERGDKSFTVLHGKENAIKLSLVFIALAGLLGSLSFIVRGMYIHLSICVVYFILGIVFIFNWVQRKDFDGDFLTMTKITNYFSYSGDILLLGMYFLL